MKRKTLVLIAGLVLLQGALVAIWWVVEHVREPSTSSSVVRTVEVRREESLDVGLPDVTLRSVGGAEIRLSELPNEGAVLHFWGTWCPPCVDELPDFLERSTASDGVAVAIAVNDSRESLEAFFDGPIPDEVVIGTPPRLLDVLQVENLPQTVFVDGQGVARRRWVGAREWTEAEWQEFRNVER